MGSAELSGINKMRFHGHGTPAVQIPAGLSYLIPAGRTSECVHKVKYGVKQTK
jgi:hypothetical protein